MHPCNAGAGHVGFFPGQAFAVHLIYLGPGSTLGADRDCLLVLHQSLVRLPSQNVLQACLGVPRRALASKKKKENQVDPSCGMSDYY